MDNITDWALNKFVAHYGKKAGVTKDAIFAYCYAVLHDPVYREKYALNLKREFPRIPFHDDFAQWAGWGQQLLDLHVGYEKAKPFGFSRVDSPSPKRAKGSEPKPKLKSDPEKGLVIVDEDTQLTGIPGEVWDYRLGNRSAIDWVLDQHKEKTPRDPTVREKFNTYRFADHKEEMIKLLAKVVTVSIKTVEITNAMRQSREGSLQKADRGASDMTTTEMNRGHDLSDPVQLRSFMKRLLQEIAKPYGLNFSEDAIDEFVRPSGDWIEQLRNTDEERLRDALSNVIERLPQPDGDAVTVSSNEVQSAISRSSCHYLWFC